MARILITGGAGFIGSNLVQALSARGDEVTVYDNFSTGCRENIAGYGDDITIVEGDIRDLDGLQRAFEGHEYVLHQAAVPSVPRSLDDPVESHEANSLGTLNVLLAARDSSVRRVVYAASSSAYGDSEVLPKVETMPTMPRSPYAADKLHGENLCRVFHLGYGLETVALRYFNVFGPRQAPESDYAAAIPRFITRMLEGAKPIVYGDGTQSRDFTYIDNVVYANIRAMESAEAVGETFNVGVGERITLNELIETIAEIMGVEAKVEYQATRKGDVMHSLASIEKAGDLMGYEPGVGLRDGLSRTIEWYRENRTDAVTKMGDEG